MKTLYLIPARGGSKGIPHKNIRPLYGLPLIGYSINVAREFADDRDICLSTDDPEIAETARKMGLDVPFMRPDSLATDKSGSYEVMLHALDFYHNRGVDYDRLVLLQPTSPMRTAADVRRALELYTPDIDMVVTVKEAESNPYYNCFEEGDDGFLQISKGDGTFTRRQDAPKAWEYNGAVYVINTTSLRQMPLGKFKRRRMCPMDAGRSIDLDTPLDHVVALEAARDVLLERMKKRAAEQGRADDTPEAIAKRLETYEKETAPLLDIYEARGLLVVVNGVGDIDEISGRIISHLE